MYTTCIKTTRTNEVEGKLDTVHAAGMARVLRAVDCTRKSTVALTTVYKLPQRVL